MGGRRCDFCLTDYEDVNESYVCERKCLDKWEEQRLEAIRPRKRVCINCNGRLDDVSDVKMVNGNTVNYVCIDLCRTCYSEYAIWQSRVNAVFYRDPSNAKKACLVGFESWPGNRNAAKK